MEKHGGVKFDTKFIGRAVPDDPRLEELKFWCGEFHRRNFAPPYGEFSQGNLSFRLKKGENAFIITGSQVGWKNRLTDDRFVTVRSCDLVKGIVYAEGVIDPSSESMMHFAIYERRSDLQAVFHGHSREVLSCHEKLAIRETREKRPYGSLELVESVLEILNQESFVVLKKHGFISMGGTMTEAGELAIQIHRMCEALKHEKRAEG
jgi:ribulose-5-phosphate 4-epimerase/fuculose-1-phosphate aldolase